MGSGLGRVRGDMANGNKDRHPNTDFNASIQRGLKALALAKKHQAALEPRLRAGTLDGLAADLESSERMCRARW